MSVDSADAADTRPLLCHLPTRDERGRPVTVFAESQERAKRKQWIVTDTTVSVVEW